MSGNTGDFICSHEISLSFITIEMTIDIGFDKT